MDKIMLDMSPYLVNSNYAKYIYISDNECSSS